MGCNRWLQVALLTALFLSLSVGASAATRKQVTMPSPKSVSDNPGGSPIKSGDTLSIPGQPVEGEYLPGINPGKGIKISPTPRIDFSIPKTINLGKSLLKGGVPGLLLGPMLQGMLDSVGGFIDEQGDVLKDGTDTVAPPTSPQDYRWQFTFGGGPLYSSPDAACQTLNNLPWSTGGHIEYVRANPTSDPVRFLCIVNYVHENGSISYPNSVYTSVDRQGTSCPAGSSFDVSTGVCVISSGPAPLSDADWSTMTDFASGQNAEWLSGLLKESCAGALDPAGCVSDLKSASSLSGPSSVPGPTTTSTTTYTKPDGTFGTETTTTTTRFNITYGSDYYDYSKTTTATTSTDGQQTSQTVTTEDASTEEDQQDQQEEDYSFTDTEFPTVEPFYEQKYPDGLSGVWQARKTEVDNSAFLSFLRSFIPDFSGSCPSWGLSFDLGFVSFGTHQFESLCYVFDFVGTIILVTALFAARSITFGG